MKYLLLLALTGCSTTNAWTIYSAHPGGSGLYRYENEEVICYSLTKDLNAAALQCKFKK